MMRVLMVRDVRSEVVRVLMVYLKRTELTNLPSSPDDIQQLGYCLQSHLPKRSQQ